MSRTTKNIVEEEIYNKDDKNTNELTVGKYWTRGDNKGKEAQVEKRFHISKIIWSFWRTMREHEYLL